MDRLLLGLLLLLAPPGDAPSGAAVSGAAPSARELNTQGYRLYRAGRYPEALERFTAAARAEPPLALAWYNVAATLGVLRQQGRVCEYGAYRETILERLTRAVQLDPERLARAREDADLEPIRDTVGWQRLLGHSPENEADVPGLLRHVTWFALGEGGSRGPQRTLTFPDARHGVLTGAVLDEKTQRLRPTREVGTYTLEGRSLRLTLPHREPVSGTLTPRGALELGGLGTFTDLPAECDA